MADWDDGYVTDVAYTRHTYREMMPSWLATLAVLAGQRPPDLTKPFRYADLGCGHGLAATIVAATCPHAEVWGFDFNPSHIESGRQLAAAAGLTNLHFRETSFAEMAARPSDALPEFDFIVSHGVASWVSRENRADFFRIIGQRLRAGGLTYISYNVTVGWASMLPVLTLMRALIRSNSERSDKAASTILEYLGALKNTGAQFFAANPSVERRLDQARQQDGRYFAHEFLSGNWHPMMFAEMAEAMASVKCSYLGSAIPTENLESLSVSPAMLPLMETSPDTIMRETLRDFGLSQSFRRDIYRRGSAPMTGPEHMRLFDAILPVWTGKLPEDPIQLNAPLGELTGLPEVYTPLMQMIMGGGHTIGSIRRSGDFSERPPTDIAQAIALLMANGYVHPATPEGVQAAACAGVDRLNAAICENIADGGDMVALAATATGIGVMVNPLEMLVLREKLAGRSLEIAGLTDRMMSALAGAGRSVQRDGNPIRDEADARAVLRRNVEAILTHRLPAFVRLGIIAG